MAVEVERAAVWEVDIASGEHRVFADGLRNANGMAWAPGGALWTVVNERDETGSDLVPDFLTSVHDGGSLSGILCARHSMTNRSMYANQQEDDEGGHAVDPEGGH